MFFQYIDIFAAKMSVAFAMRKLLTFTAKTINLQCKSYSHLQQKISMYLPYVKIEILMSHLLTTSFSFEQLDRALKVIACWVTLHAFLLSVDFFFFFFFFFFFKTFFQEYHQSVKQFKYRSGPNLNPNCLQRLSAEDKSHI